MVNKLGGIEKHANSLQTMSQKHFQTKKNNRNCNLVANESDIKSVNESQIMPLKNSLRRKTNKVKNNSWERTIDIYLSGLLTRRQNAWSQDGGNMRVIANGVNRGPVSRSTFCFCLFWYVALCRVV